MIRRLNRIALALMTISAAATGLTYAERYYLDHLVCQPRHFTETATLIIAISIPLAAVIVLIPTVVAQVPDYIVWIRLGISAVAIALLLSLQASLTRSDGGMRFAAYSPISNLRALFTAQVAYQSSFGGKYGTMDELTGAGLLDSRPRELYAYSISLTPNGFRALANRLDPDVPYSDFFITEEGVVRYAEDSREARRGCAGLPVE